ncbi:MAG: protein kinase, partial [Myxococcales bacterium]|nr:protein kinase [Myxococcales bacterium]
MADDGRAATGAAPFDERFEVRGTLGSGGVGTVFRVFDRRLGREVALKVLRSGGARSLYRFKREFRALTDILHPGLIALHELHTTTEDWFFTMELVEGVRFIDWVRRRPVGDLDEGRLRAALVQLVDAVLALHVAGKLHRDLKPSNVLVTAEGRVVVLDFGLISDVDNLGADATHERAAVGTPAYMSPEQAADLALTPASDWYAVGVMLYEALTGRRPFEGTPEQILARKQRDTAPPPRQLEPTVAADLDALCHALLRHDPDQRPDGRSLLAALGAAPSEATLELERSAAVAPFVGRARELKTLREAFLDARRRGVAVFVGGDSGMGKTQLVRRFLDGLDDEVLILEGRCYEREQVPYKALDAVVDVVTSVLLRLDATMLNEVVPRDVAALAILFPVLRRVPAITVRCAGAHLPPDPHELRRRAFGALRYLLRRLAADRPVVVSIDDLQWGDADSAVFLGDLVHHPERLLLIFTHRLEDDAGVVARVLDDGGLGAGDVRRVELGPLDDAAARGLVEALAPDATAEHFVHNAGGH